MKTIIEKAEANKKTGERVIDRISERLENRKLLKELSEVYNYQCAICSWKLKNGGMQGGCEFHHIKSYSNGGKYTKANLILLCPNHHKTADAGFISVKGLESYQVWGYTRKQKTDNAIKRLKENYKIGTTTNKKGVITMAYMSQENKKEIQTKLRPILKKYKVKASLSVLHHSSICLNIKSSPIDFLGNYNKVYGKIRTHANNPFVPEDKCLQVNEYWFHEHFDGEALEFLIEVKKVMDNGNHDRSDIQTDYFDVGWYININIGRWDKPYQFIK